MHFLHGICSNNFWIILPQIISMCLKYVWYIVDVVWIDLLSNLMAVLSCFPKHGNKFLLTLFFVFVTGGFYQDQIGQMGCKTCSNGTFVAEKDRPGTSAVSCRACPYGKEYFVLKSLARAVFTRVCRKYFAFSLVWHDYAKRLACKVTHFWHPKTNTNLELYSVIHE